MTHPFIISIITPSYNQGNFLAETIESVISQEGDFELDYIIMDGGSTDGSVAIIRRYDELLQRGEWPVRCRKLRLRWVSEKDRGQADALTKGFRHAEGEIFAWLNSDDTYLPGTLAAVADCFRQQPDLGLLYGDAHYCDTAGSVVGRYRTGDFDFERLAWFNFICQPAAFFRRDAYEAAGGLDGSLQFAMDYDLWIRIGRRFPCRFLPRLLATYRLHDTSKTVRDETLRANCEEALQVALKQFHWAPLTRVYTWCHALCSSRLPAHLARRRWLLVPLTMLCTIFQSLRLNRGFRSRDLHLLQREHFRNLGKSRMELMTGAQPGVDSAQPPSSRGTR